MKKLLIGMVALLAMTGMAVAGNAAFDFGAAAGDPGTTIVVPLWARGNTEVDAMALGLEVQAPLQITGFQALQAGMLLGTNNDGGVLYIDPSGIAMTFDAANPSTTIHNPALSANPMLVGNISVFVPAGTAKTSYSISTVSPYFGDYASGMAFAGAGVDVTQKIGQIVVTPEPMTALLLLGVLPLLRRRHA